MVLQAVKVPEHMVPLFEKAEEYVKDYFSKQVQEPQKGTITIGGERYVMMRAKSLRVDLMKSIGDSLGIGQDVAADATDHFLYMMAKSMGRSDAKHFIEKQGVEDPIEKLAAGPIIFSYSGWAFVEILGESKPSPDENFFLVYDHPYSFEEEAFEHSEEKPVDCPVCIMNSGYSAGWCSESFGIELDGREIMCRSKGDNTCRFVMGPKQRLDEYEHWVKEHIN
ncbi:MAG: V4R domain-containing protein [Nanobdellota archaeon]